MREDRPSSTATLIAAATVFLARDRRLSDLVPADAASACAQFLKSASPATAAIVDTISRPAWRWAARLAERMTVPGLPLHFIVRKRCIEDAVRAGIAGGARQVVIEGLLMYLSQEAVNAVFNALSDARRARTRVVFTLMEPAPDGRLAFHNATLLERWLLSLWREPFQSAMPRGEIDAFLDSHGYSTMSIADADALRAGYLAPSHRDALTLARGELVVVAERGHQP